MGSPIRFYARPSRAKNFRFYARRAGRRASDDPDGGYPGVSNRNVLESGKTENFDWTKGTGSNTVADQKDGRIFARPRS